MIAKSPLKRVGGNIIGAMPTLAVGMSSRRFSCSRKCEHGTRCDSLVLVFFICAWFLPGTVAAAEKPDDVDIQLMPLPGGGGSDGTAHGYVEFRLRLKNNSDRARTAYLSYPGFESSYRSGESGVITREVTVEKRQEAWVSIYQPPIEVSSHMLDVSVEGMDKPKQLSAPSPFGARYYRWGTRGGAVPAILFGRNVPQEFRDRVEKEESGLPEEERSGLFRSELPTGQWSPNWLGYSCYDAIVLTESEAAELPPAARTAIRRYVECGGKLVVHGPQMPEEFTKGGSPGGAGVYHAGLGRAVSTGAADAAGWNVAYSEIEHSPSNRLFVREYRATEGVEPAGIKPPGAKVGKITSKTLADWLVEEADFPARMMFALLAVFAIGIGPVNIWMLAKHKKRIWLWWNVPVISFAACAAIFLYAMFSEGWSGRGKAVSFTILDERAHRAATIENLSYYCPLTPSSGLHFSPECEVTILSQRKGTTSSYGGPSREDNVRRTVDWTNDQTFGSGWITARVAAGFQVRKNEDRLERLVVRKKSDDAIHLVNALGADIQKLWLADASGRVYESGQIGAGAEIEIQSPIKGARASGKGPAILRKLILRAPGEFNIDDFPFNEDKSELLAPGTYLAVLSDSPFIESPLAGVSLAGSPAVVYGISKVEEDGR
jgi:hypothetical protein